MPLRGTAVSAYTQHDPARGEAVPSLSVHMTGEIYLTFCSRNLMEQYTVGPLTRAGLYAWLDRLCDVCDYQPDRTVGNIKKSLETGQVL